MSETITLKKRSTVDRLKYNIQTIEHYLRLLEASVKMLESEAENAEVLEPTTDRPWYAHIQEELLEMEEALTNIHENTCASIFYPWSQDQMEWILKVCQGKLSFDVGCIESSVRGMIWTDLIVKYHASDYITLEDIKKVIISSK